jgi:hypothetical protein
VKLQIDIEFPFLKEFVDSALANGARLYFHKNERLDMDSGIISFVSRSPPMHYGLKLMKPPLYPFPLVLHQLLSFLFFQTFRRQSLNHLKVSKTI